jgi:hypothetical protein
MNAMAAIRARYEFSYKTVEGDSAPATRIGMAATAPLTSELAGGFTGTIGMYAEGAGKNKPMPPAISHGSITRP